MTTPADWYPDPEDPAGLRYWDGASWTEHRAPAFAPPAPSQPPATEPPAAEPPAPAADEVPATDHATSVVSLPPEQSTTVISTGPATDLPLGADVQSGTHGADPGQEPPPFDPSQPWDAPLPAWDSPVAETPRTWETPPAETEPRTETDTPTDTPTEDGAKTETRSETDTPRSFDTPPLGQSYAPPPSQPPSHPYEPASFVPSPVPRGGPSGGPSDDGPNMKLVFGIIGGAAAILLAIIVVIALVVIGKDEPAVTASQGTSSSESATSSSETSTPETQTESSATEAPLPPPTGAQGSDGDYTFSVVSTETGDTITSTVSDAVETTADGMYYVVHLNVANTGSSPLTFVATFQQLSAAGQTFPLDDTATAFLGGTVADIAPGSQVETPLVYDIPVGTLPDSMLLRADPVSPGVTLPLQ